jgi:hypothetical protein
MSETLPNPSEVCVGDDAQAGSEPLPAIETAEGDAAVDQEPTPMLDVHDAHHAASTWREFFIHIATIVLGLMIAVGLEQTVEYVHERRALTQARRELSEEKRVNIEGFHRSVASFRASSAYLKEYLATLRRSIKDPAVAVPALRVPIDFVYSQYTAWGTAQREGALTLMPSEEQSANDRMYVGLHAVDEVEDRAYVSVQHAKAVFLSGEDPHDLTLEQKQELYRDASLALSDVRSAVAVQGVTVYFSPEFGDGRSLDPAAIEEAP